MFLGEFFGGMRFIIFFKKCFFFPCGFLLLISNQKICGQVFFSSYWALFFLYLQVQKMLSGLWLKWLWKQLPFMGLFLSNCLRKKVWNVHWCWHFHVLINVHPCVLAPLLKIIKCKLKKFKNDHIILVLLIIQEISYLAIFFYLFLLFFCFFSLVKNW